MGFAHDITCAIGVVAVFAYLCMLIIYRGLEQASSLSWRFSSISQFPVMYSPSQEGVYAVSVVLIIVSTVSVALRVTARRLNRIALGADDWTIILALLFVWALGAVNIVGAAAGSFGTHTLQDSVTGRTLPTWHENQVAKLSYSSQIINVVADGIIKLSLLLMYKRLFLGKVFNIISWLALGLIASWTVTFFFGTVFVCGRNPAWQWLSVQTIAAHCGSIRYVWLSHAVTDVATDLLVMLIPIPMIWQLNMKPRAKLALISIFALGLISTGAGTARLVYVAEDIYETTTGYRDVRAVQTNISVWGTVEAGVGVITACLVTFRPLLHTRTVESIVNSARSAFSLVSRIGRPSTERHPSDTTSLNGKQKSEPSNEAPSV